MFKNCSKEVAGPISNNHSEEQEPCVEYQKNHGMINYHFKLVFRYLYIQVYIVRKMKKVRLYCNVICLRCIIEHLKKFSMEYFTWKHEPNNNPILQTSNCNHNLQSCKHKIDFIHLNCKYSDKNRYWIEEIFSFIKNLLKIQFIRRISIRNENPKLNEKLSNITFIKFVQSTFSNKVKRIPLQNLAENIQKFSNFSQIKHIQKHLNTFYLFFFDIFLTQTNIKLTFKLNTNDVNSFLLFLNLFIFFICNYIEHLHF